MNNKRILWELKQKWPNKDFDAKARNSHLYNSTDFFLVIKRKWYQLDKKILLFYREYDGMKLRTNKNNRFFNYIKHFEKKPREKKIIVPEPEPEQNNIKGAL